MTKPTDDAAGVALTVTLAVLGVFVTYVPITAVSISLTTIGQATGASTSDLQWVSDSYIIPMAATILSAGAFGDLHGRRRVYLTGMALTVVGATIAGLAGTLDGRSALHVLWLGQAITGAGGGIMLPTTLALIAHAVPDLRARARFVAMWSTGLVLGLALGPLAAGLILESLSWGWIFAPTAILALGAGVLAALRLPESRAPEGRHLDWPGQITATIAIAASIYGVIEGGQAGWGSVQAIAGLGIGAIALVAFIVVEARSTSPILNLGLFRSPAFSASGFAALIGLFALVGGMFLLSIFLGGTQHLAPLAIAVRLLFLNGTTAVVNPFVGRLMGRVAPIMVLTIGLAIAALSMFLLTGMQADTGFADTAWRLARPGRRGRVHAQRRVRRGHPVGPAAARGHGRGRQHDAAPVRRGARPGGARRDLRRAPGGRGQHDGGAPHRTRRQRHRAHRGRGRLRRRDARAGDGRRARGVAGSGSRLACRPCTTSPPMGRSCAAAPTRWGSCTTTARPTPTGSRCPWHGSIRCSST